MNVQEIVLRCFTDIAARADNGIMTEICDMMSSYSISFSYMEGVLKENERKK